MNDSRELTPAERKLARWSFWQGVLYTCVLGSIVVLVIALIWFYGVTTSSEVDTTEVDTTASITKPVWQRHGNYSFLTLDARGIAFNNREIVLSALSVFEKDHPELKVLSFQIDDQKPELPAGSRAIGIWLHHLDRTKLATDD